MSFTLSCLLPSVLYSTHPYIRYYYIYSVFISLSLFAVRVSVCKSVFFSVCCRKVQKTDFNSTVSTLMLVEKSFSFGSEKWIFFQQSPTKLFFPSVFFSPCCTSSILRIGFSFPPPPFHLSVSRSILRELADTRCE